MPFRGEGPHPQSLGAAIDQLFTQADQMGLNINRQQLGDWVRATYNWYEKHGWTPERALQYVYNLELTKDGTVKDKAGNVYTPSTGGGGGGTGGGGNGPPGSGGGMSVITDSTGKTGYDTNGDGKVDVEYDPTDAGATDSYSVKDYLGAVVGNLNINSEIRGLAQKAADQQWTMNEWNLALSKTDTYQNRQSINYQSMLQDLGFTDTGALSGLIDSAVAQGYTESEFMYYLRQTKEYHQRFKGIYNKQGKMIMSEAEYIAFERNVQQLAKSYGYHATSVDIAQALRKGIDIQSYEERLQALQRVNEYAPAMKSLLDAARARGMNIPKNVTKRELYDIVTGKADPAFYKLWEETSGRTAAFTAGIDVIDKGEKGGQYTDLKRGALMKVLHTLPGYQSEADVAQGLSEAADSFLRDLPDAKIQSLGLTKDQILRAQFGGKNAAALRKKIEHIAKQAEAQASNELAAGPSYVGQGGGLSYGGGAKKPVTE